MNISFALRCKRFIRDWLKNNLWIKFRLKNNNYYYYIMNVKYKNLKKKNKREINKTQICAL